MVYPEKLHDCILWILFFDSVGLMVVLSGGKTSPIVCYKAIITK